MEHEISGLPLQPQAGCPSSWPESRDPGRDSAIIFCDLLYIKRGGRATTPALLKNRTTKPRYNSVHPSKKDQEIPKYLHLDTAADLTLRSRRQDPEGQPGTHQQKR